MRVTESITIYRRIGILAICFLAVLSVSRAILIGVYFERVSAVGGVGFILAQGIRFDIILLGLILGPVLMLKPWLHLVACPPIFRQWLLPLFVGLAAGTGLFIEASTTSFVDQFDSRPNYVFVEYLVHPDEVMSILVGAYPLEFLVCTVLAVLAGVFALQWLRTDPHRNTRVSILFCIVATPVAAVLALAMVRSTLDHRPVNPSIAAYSQDSLVNQLPLNSPYTVLYSIYERNRDAARDDIRYGEMADDEVLQIVLSEADIGPEDQLDLTSPTLHHQAATKPREKPLNLVIVLQESVGADYVGSLGGKDLTPEFDQMADQGIFFERLYATGLRSVRGIEAVITGFTPRAQLSVVKLAETQRNFFTLASLLERHGYQTSFIYGGEAHFDNMKRFFLGNGFQTVIDEKDYEQPVYTGSWGVSDEDLFQRAHETFSNAGSQPFFSLVFTSSNHTPFDIPEGRVSESPYGLRETAINYADYALGRFLENARQSDYWDNTVFLVVADHSVRVVGGKLVPVERFRIPGAIVGGSIEPRRISGITSQIDLFPTLLSLIGLSSNHPGIGRDLTLPSYANGAGRALMQFNDLQGYMENDRVVVLQPDLEPMTFRTDASGAMILVPEGDRELERKALAHSRWGPMTIRNKAYFNYPGNR